MTTFTSRTEHRATRPATPWQPPSQVHELSRTGPVASVYLGTRDDVRDGADRVLTRWQAVRRRLQGEGATGSMLGALDECLRRAPLRGRTVAAFAAADGRSHVEHLSRTVEDRAWLGPFPHLSPLLGARHREVPVVVVATGRRGADLRLVEPGVPDLLCQVVGEDLLIGGSVPDGPHEVPDGPHEQLARAEEQWAADARAVAECLTWLVDCSRARLVVAGGRAGALHLLRAQLDPRIRSLLVTARTCPDPGPLTARARLMAADAAALEEATLVEEVLAALPDGRARVGAAPTLQAVVHGQAEEVLVSPERADRHRVRRLVLDGAAGVTPRGTAAPTGRSALLSDVLVHAAVATSTTVRTVRDGRRLEHGVGALLRGAFDVPARRRTALP